MGAEVTIQTVEAARIGGTAERDALVEVVWPDAYRIAFAILRRQHPAEDAAQEACITLCRSIATLRSAAAFRVWFYRIVAREVSSARRRLERTMAMDVEDRAPVDHLETIDVWRALASIPGPLRDVVVLRYFEDLSSREIASVLGIPDGTVRFRLMIAKRRLMPLLQDDTHHCDLRSGVGSHAI